jgi:Ser/Thr protein kinase RdoA (MazF antagonist)
MMPALFSIETNRGGSCVAVPQAEVDAAAADYFSVGTVRKAENITKPSRSSELYRLETERGLVALRCSREDAALLEQRGAISQQLRSNFLKLQRGKDGYVYAGEGGVWCCYPWLDGACWDGTSPPFADIAKASIAFAAELAAVDLPPDRQRQLGKPAFALGDWRDCVTFLLADYRRDDSPFSDALSSVGANVLSWAQTALPAVIEDAIAARGGVAGLAHNDLNHSNVLIGLDRSIHFLDMEDLFYNDIRFSLAHALFKLSRHAVYSQALSVDDARQWMAANVPAAVNDRMAREVFRSREELFLLCAALALADVCACVRNVARGEETWRLYDLEKRIHNIAEAAVLCGFLDAKDVQAF